MHAHEKRVCMNSWQQHWQQQLAEREQRHLLRRVRLLGSAQGADVEVDGKRYQSFISNDYLGFANHPALKKALADGAEKYGAGSGASHLLGGHSRAHQQLEEELAAFTGRDRALLFSTGYMANLGVMFGYSAKGDYANAIKHADKAIAQATNDPAKKQIEGNIAKLKENKDVN